jgi:hypothetical protein
LDGGPGDVAKILAFFHGARFARAS